MWFELIKVVFSCESKTRLSFVVFTLDSALSFFWNVSLKDFFDKKYTIKFNKIFFHKKFYFEMDVQNKDLTNKMKIFLIQSEV